jgi:hypothetical protein
MRAALPLLRAVTTLSFCLTSLGLAMAVSQTGALPVSTAIPVSFTHSIEAGKTKPGTVVTAKSIQFVSLPDGRSLPKGTVVVGHVVDDGVFQFDSAPYAHQKPSYISIHFDRIKSGNLTVPINVTVRALANTIESEEASRPHYLDETDRVGTMNLIGGGEYTPFDHEIKGDDGDAIGYNRKQGVFARLLASESATSGSTVECRGTETEQSIAIFSPSACGLYGFDTIYMPQNGSSGDGTFRLESRHHTIKLYAGSTALLQVLPDSPQISQKN